MLEEEIASESERRMYVIKGTRKEIASNLRAATIINK